MKKFHLILLSLFTIVLSSVLMACSFKEFKAQFVQEQLVFNASERLDLKNFLRVENISKDEIEFVVSDSSTFDLSGSVISVRAGESGKGLVYATYHENRLANMEVVARKKFDAPRNVRWDEQGFVTWDAVSGIFDGETEQTVAEKYIVSGRRVAYDEDGAELQSIPLESTQVSERRFEIPRDQNGDMIKGEYHLTVQALQNGFFSNSNPSQEAVIPVGFMPQLTKDDFTFVDGKLSWTWDVTDQAEFQVKIDDVKIESRQKETSIDLSKYFNVASPGQYAVKVLAFDDSDNENKLFTRESETLLITKLSTPSIRYSFDAQRGGQLELQSYDSAQNFKIFIQPENGAEKILNVANTPSGSAKTSLDGNDDFEELPSALYSIKVVATSPNTDDEFFFQSDESVLDKKVYKLPKARISGNDGNLWNANTFHAKASVTVSNVDTNFLLSNVNEVVAGFDVSTTEKNFEFSMQNAGVFDITIVQLPKNNANVVNGQVAYVINSDPSDKAEFVKMPQISGEITHTYQGEQGQEKSLLTFKQVGIETSVKEITYKLKLKKPDGSFEDVPEEDIDRFETKSGDVTFLLTSTIEKLLEPTSAEGYVLAVEVATKDPNLTISSLTERTLSVLSAPQSADNSFLAENDFVWKSASGQSPAEYRLEIFSITKEIYEAQQDADLSEFVPDGQEGVKRFADVYESAPRHHFDEGYYFVRIFAISDQENEILSSHECLEQVILVSKRLHIDNVKFGYEETLGYYLEIESSDENVKGFSISVDDTSKDFVKTSTNKYSLSNGFDDSDADLGIFAEAKTYDVTISAYGTDPNGQKDVALYLSAEDSLKVVKLAQVIFEDLDFDDETKSFDIHYGAGTKKIEVALENGKVEATEQENSVRVDIADQQEFTLKFQKIASDAYEIVTVDGGKGVYISSQESQIKFKRLTSPTNLAYSNGKITFTHTNEVQQTDNYVLELVLNYGEGETYPLSLTLNVGGDANSVKIGTTDFSQTLSLGGHGGENIYSASGNDVSVCIEKIFDAFDGTLRELYNLSTSVDFSVWAYRLHDAQNEEDGTVQLSSLFATAPEPSDSTIKVEKMKKVLLTFVDNGNRSLTWSEVEQGSEVKAETTYVLHQLSTQEEFNKTFTSQSESSKFSGNSFSLEGADFESHPSINFTYYVEATNPKYLASSDSNYIIIFKNPKVSSSHIANSIYLSGDGTLSFDIPDMTKSKGVEVKIKDAHAGTPQTVEGSPIVDGRVKISKAGEYSFQILGTESQAIENEDSTIYYLNGDVATWTVTDLKDVQQNGKVTYAGNIISWTYPFQDEKDMGNLRYAIFFHQETNKNYQYFTTPQETQAKQVDLMQNAALKELLGKLTDDEVEVQVCAYIEPHIASEGSEIFYASETDLLNGGKEWNYHALQDKATITKLSAPVIEKVEFVGFETKEEGESVEDEASNEQEWQKRQTPTIKITFSGKNYGTEATFQAYFGLEENPVVDADQFHPGDEDGKYYFELTADKYTNLVNNGGAFEIKIYALTGGRGESVGSLPSAPTIIKFERASMISDIQFLSDDYGKQHPEDSEDKGIGHGRIVQIAINDDDADQFVGSMVLKIVYTPNSAQDGLDMTQHVGFKTAQIKVGDGKITFGDETNKWIEDFINEKLVEGGEIEIFAYADFYASKEANKYILPCTQEIGSGKYVVLQHVANDQAHINRVGVGFEIEGVTNNSDDTIYVLEYVSHEQTKTLEVACNNEGRFVFEAPSDWEVSTFNIFAVQQDKNGQKYIRSKKESISFELKRLASVGEDGEILLVRNSDQTLSLKWNKVENATGYMVRVFAKTSEGKGDLLCENVVGLTSGSAVGDEVQGLASGDIFSCYLSEIFGQNYSELRDVDLTQDLEIYLELTALGTGEYNNSLVKTIYATIQGNDMSVENGDVYVEDGLAYMKQDAGKNYMYRFVYSNVGSGLTDWTDVTEKNGYLDTFGDHFKDLTNRQFDIEVFVKANETSSSESHFLFDSKIFTTRNDNSFTYEKLPDILDVTYSRESEEIVIKFEENEKNERHVFVGVEQNAILSSGKTVLIDLGNEDSGEEFKVPFNKILLALDTEEIDYSSISNIYFWAYENNVNGIKYILSQPYDKFKFSVETDFAVKEILRLKDVEGFAKGEEEIEQNLNLYAAGWTNTYMTFEKKTQNGSTLLGINVKLVHRDTGKTFTYFAAASKLNVESKIEFEEYRDALLAAFGDRYVINLNTMFDDAEVVSDDEETYLVDLAGLYDISVMKVSEKDGSYVVSKWISVWHDDKTGKDRDLTFQKLEKIRNLQLSNGNLYWGVAEDIVDEYYVYFYDYVENGEPTSYRIVLSNTKKDAGGNLVPQNWLDASTFAMEKHAYFLAVQSVDHEDYDDRFVIASQVTFKRDFIEGAGDITVVRKNQINVTKSPLKLNGSGTLAINWADDETDQENFITILKKKNAAGSSFNYNDIAKLLSTTIFTSPFTFTLSDLLNGKVNLRLRFTPQNESGLKVDAAQTFDVPALDILEDLFTYCATCPTGSFDFEALLTGLKGASGDESMKNLMALFADKFENKKSGIGSSSVFMDDCLESLQAGKYSLQYCLRGDDFHTLSSEWYSFANSEGENTIVINTAPKVNVIKVENSDVNLPNTYKIVFEKSKVTTVSGEQTADNYYLRIGNVSFLISKMDAQYKLTLIENGSASDVDEPQQDKFVKVYEANSDGSEWTNDGTGEAKYLAFVLNIESDSLMAIFGADMPSDNAPQNFEICAVGNTTSLSSKSVLWKFTFLTFTNFSIRKGQFEWAVPGIATKIVVKRSGNSNLTTETLEGIYAASTFSLGEGYGDGLYDYIKFMLIGGISAIDKNVVRVDSEILTVRNVFKLHEVTMSNNMNYIGVTVGDDNYNKLKDIYSNTNHFTYEIRNDVAQIADVRSTSLEFSDDRKGDERKQELYYVPGVTGISQEQDPDYYDFKLTEQTASHFDVRVLGTTATLRKKNTDKYYEKDVYCLDQNTGELVGDEEVGNGEKVVKIATCSNWGSGIDARMMESVQNFAVKDSMLVWDAVVGREGDEVENGATVVYRLEIERYVIQDDGLPYFWKEKDIVYTAQTTYDMSSLQEEERWQDYVLGLNYKVTIRAMALKVSETIPQEPYVTLIDGNKAGGKNRYQSGKYTLISEGNVKDGITRLDAPVAGSVRVEDRKLTWQYVSQDDTLTVDNFKEHLDFAVVASSTDEDVESGNVTKPFEVTGEFTVEQIDAENGNGFKIIFTEDADTLPGGKHKITIYTKLPQGVSGDKVRSFGVSGEIEKLDKFTSDDYVIETNYANQRETLSLEKFFKTDDGTEQVKNSDKIVRATIGEESFEFKPDQYKLYILRDRDEVFDFYDGDNYIRHVVVVGDSESKDLAFTVESTNEEILSSDPSETFVLDRAQWSAGATILWDDKKEEFSWDAQEWEFMEYVVEATYSFQSDSGPQQIKRIYSSKETSFKPTIIGQVQLSLRVKFNNNNLQSEALSNLVGNGVKTSSDGGKYVEFDLFASGSGTQEDPYIIGDANDAELGKQQFANLAQRQVKDENVVKYVEIAGNINSNKTEEDEFYFSLATDIDLGDISGIMFNGDFGGVISGNEHTISYVSSTNERLTSNINISDLENVAEIKSGVRSIAYNRGSAVFETLRSSAKIEDVKIDVKFGEKETTGPSIMAGLAISNNGVVKNVTLVGFSSSFKAKDDRGVMTYAGLVGRNMGNIEQCNVETPIEINDLGQSQFIFVSGLVYTNYATINGCVSGKSGQPQHQTITVKCSAPRSFVQISGIAITNTLSAGKLLSDCTNNFDLCVEGPQNNDIKCYIAGVVVLGLGLDSSMDSLHNSGYFKLTNIDNKNVVQTSAKIVATTSVQPSI